MQMAKKVVKTFKAELHKNVSKGGGWLGSLSATQIDPASGRELVLFSSTTAWASLSAAKRWVKYFVQTQTTRKNIKYITTEHRDEKEKPISYIGTFNYRQESSV